MHVTPPLPLLKRVPPGAWVALTWCATTLFTFLTRIRLPGEHASEDQVAAQFYRWDGLVVLALATVMALAGGRLLRRRPLGALALLLAAAGLATTDLAVGAIQLSQFLAVDLALSFVAATRPRRTGLVALGMALAVLVGWIAVRLLRGWGVGTSVELAVALTAVVCWLLGDATHRTRGYTERLTAQAATQAVTDERLRIAREMHDLVAHSIGIIALQAGAAARVVHTQPEAARDAMTAVENTSREALSGLRRMLGALRETESGTARPDGERDGEAPPGVRPRRPRPARRGDDGRGGPGRGGPAGRAPPASAGHRPVGLPDHPGVDHQCRPALGCAGLPGERRAGRRRTRPPRHRRGPWAGHRHGHRLRSHRHARAGGPAARRVRGRSPPRGRIPGHGPAARPTDGGRPMTIRVVLADDQQLIRTALRMVVADLADMEVVGEAADGAEAVALAGELDPDVVVMDIRMPGMDGIEATRRITSGPGGSRIVVLTTFDEDDHVYGALRAGASGFLVKDMALDDILAAVRVVAAGDALIAPGVTRRLIRDFTATRFEQPRATRELTGITEREREVLTLVGTGLSNTEIAERLFISVATAKTYLTRLLSKLDARDRVQLVIIAYEAGLVSATDRR